MRSPYTVRAMRSTSIGAVMDGGSLRVWLVAAAAALPALAACDKIDDAFCENGNCGWSKTESARISELADLPAAPPSDLSNAYVGIPEAMALGQQLFFDARLSGTSTMTDSIGRPVPFARAAKGQPLNISCATCHDLRGGAADPS